MVDFSHWLLYILPVCHRTQFLDAGLNFTLFPRGRKLYIFRFLAASLVSYHDEHELNALIDKFWLFSKNICRIVIIRLVLESGRFELSLRCFPIEFGPFFMILWDFEKIVILGVWQSCNIRVVKHVPHLPNLKIRPGLLFVENIFFYASNDLQTFCYGLPGNQRYWYCKVCSKLFCSV